MDEDMKDGGGVEMGGGGRGKGMVEMGRGRAGKGMGG